MRKVKLKPIISIKEDRVARRYRTVKIQSIEELTSLDGYIHSHIKNYIASRETLGELNNISWVKGVKQSLLDRNWQAAKALKLAREELERTSANYHINAEELTKIIQSNLQMQNFEEEFNQMQKIWQEEGTWTKEKIDNLKARTPLINEMFKDMSDVTNSKTLPTYKGALQKLETSNTIASQYLKTKNQKTQKKLSEGIVNTRLSAFGLLREVAIARALDTLYNDQQKVQALATGLPQNLTDVQLTIPDIGTFGFNIKSSSTTYYNQTASHWIDMDHFWGEHKNDYGRAAHLIDYIFWNDMALRYYAVDSKQTDVALPPISNIQGKFTADIMAIYQLCYLFSVMVAHESIQPNTWVIDEIKGTPDAAQDKTIWSHYMVSKNKVLNTDDVYFALIERYEKLKWDQQAQSMIPQPSRLSSDMLSALHDYKKIAVQSYGKNNKRHITYKELKDNPKIRKMINDIFKTWGLSHSKYYVKFKVDLGQLLK